MRPIVVIIALEVISFGIFSSRLGFYHDDWVLLEDLGKHPGLWNTVLAVARSNYGARPASIPIFALLHHLAGEKPLLYHLALPAFDAAGGVLFYIFLKKVLKNEAFALLAACLALIYPVHAATHHWVTNIAQPAAQALILLSMVLHWGWLETGKRAGLAASMTAYLAGALCYEAGVLLPLMSGAAVLANARVAGRTLRASAREALGSLAPFGVVLLIVLFWAKKGMQLVMGYENPKTLALSVPLMLKVMGDGLDCLTLGMLRVCADASAWSLKESTPAGLILWAVFTIAVARFLMAAEPAVAPTRKTALKHREAAAHGSLVVILWMGVLGFLAAYVPYALGGYGVKILGLAGRVNGGAGLSAGLLLAAAILEVSRRISAPMGLKGSGSVQGALLAMTVGVFTATNWTMARHWGDAWKAQMEGVERISRRTAELPGSATLLVLWNQPSFYGADMFFLDEPWGFDSALKLKTGRKGMTINLQTPWMTGERAGVIERFGSTVRRSYSYEDLYQYDMATDKLIKLVPPS
ncbi:MAG: hypothetical protein AAB320_10830 [Elusimicrobiota bacterium]